MKTLLVLVIFVIIHHFFVKHFNVVYGFVTMRSGFFRQSVIVELLSTVQFVKEMKDLFEIVFGPQVVAGHGVITVGAMLPIGKNLFWKELVVRYIAL